MSMRVFIDSCAVNRLALVNVDPTRELAGSEFQLAVTPDLEIEYRQALGHVYVPPHVKGLIGKLLERCERRDLIGSDGPAAGLDADVLEDDSAMDAVAAVPVRRRPGLLPPNRTDSHLIALATTALVITDDRKQLRRWGDGQPGLIPWLDIEVSRSAGICLLEVLRDRAKRLPSEASR